MLDAILKLFPLDTAETQPVCVMQTADGMERPPVWTEFEDVIKNHEPDGRELTEIERFAFYEKAKNAYAIISTGDGYNPEAIQRAKVIADYLSNKINFEIRNQINFK